MICLLAAAAATLGSRWWLLALVAQQRLGAAAAWLVIAGTAVLAASLSAWFGFTIAQQFRGPGMLLLLGLALVFAAASMAWPVRPLSAKLRESMAGPGAAAILLGAAMLSDSAPFIILAATAWTGEAVLAGAGGATGLIAAAVFAGPIFASSDSLPTWWQPLRWAIAALLLVIAAVTSLAALGVL